MNDILTSNEVMSYLGIDYADDMILQNIKRTIRTADAFLEGAIGKEYPRNDPRAKEVALIITADLYDNRVYTNSAAMTNNVRRLVDDMCLQLRLELGREQNGENV